MRSATGVADIARQVGRVRWRRNLHAVQLAVLAAVAAVAAGAAVVVLLAVRADGATFVLGTAAVSAGALAVAGAGARAAGRRWMRRPHAARWVDDAAGLGGRLATLLALRRHDGAFVPLLVAQTLERRDAWAPTRLVPRAVPRGALGAAIAAVAVLALAVWVAPRLVPPPPELTWSDEALPPPPVADAERAAPERRVALATARTGTSSGISGPATPGTQVPPSARAGGPAHAPTLQERIRRRVLAGHGTAAAPTGGAGDRTASSGGGAGSGSRAGTEPDASRRGEGRSTAGDAARPGTGATGAGTGTDPTLLGAPADDTTTAGGRFAVGLGATMRGPRARGAPLAGDTSPAEPDAHPPLAPTPRIAALPARATVPAEYEDVVRALFAHRADGGP